MAWGDPDDNDNGFNGFSNSGFGGSGGGSSSGGGGFGGGKTTNSGGGFGNKSSGFGGSKNVSFGAGGNKSNSNSTPRPTTSSNWKPPKLIRDFEPVGNLNKMIGVHNIPFFGQTQAFMGRTLWDYFKRSKAHFSDIIDRLNCHIVPMFLMFFVMLISANIFGAFGMEPMRCLRSPELNDEEREYALDYCQSKNTYYVAPEEGIPWSNKERRERQLGYYHWVPIMMFLQAMLFMLPNWLWNALNQQSGIEYVKFIEESCRLKSLALNDPERTSLVRELSERMSEAILNREVYFHRRMGGCRFGQSMGSYVSWLYVFIKLLYLVNVSAQFWILNSFIGVTYRFWGVDVLKALLAGENWQDSPVFPRLTLCDVPIRRLGDTPRYTLQCHLRINTYNEKIYLFIWWGFLLVAGLTFCNFCYYLLVLIFLPCSQENSVRHLLKQERHEKMVYSKRKYDRRVIKRFAEEALAKDGVLLFWFIESHAGPIVARELLGEIFENYKVKTNYEDDPSEIEVVKKGKGSFSSQSTGSLNDDDEEWGGGFGNGGVQPSAPPKFPPGESTSFTSSQERDLADGDADGGGTDSSHMYASTPKHNPLTQRGNGATHHMGRPSNDNGFYSDKERRRHEDRRNQDGGGGGGNFLGRFFRFIFGGGAQRPRYNNYQHQQLLNGTTPFATASYYGGRSMVKNV